MSRRAPTRTSPHRPRTMNRAAIFSLLALFTLAAPRAINKAGSDESTPESSSDALRLAVPAAFEEGARRTSGLSGYALRDALDELALSPRFWAGFQEFMEALATSPQAKRQIDEFMRAEASRQVGFAPPGVPQHVLLRAMAAASAAVELLPAGLNLMELMGESQVDFSLVFAESASRLEDRAIPVAIRRMERRALRGMVAAITAASVDVLADPNRCTELLSLYAEGMEHAVLLISLALQGNDADRADIIIRELRLEPPDRAALAWRRDQLAEAEATLRNAAEELDGDPLKLPPDRGLTQYDS